MADSSAGIIARNALETAAKRTAAARGNGSLAAAFRRPRRSNYLYYNNFSQNVNGNWKCFVNFFQFFSRQRARGADKKIAKIRAGVQRICGNLPADMVS